MKLNSFYGFIPENGSWKLLRKVVVIGVLLFLGSKGYGQGVIVGPISGTTTEAGGTATFTMVLTSLPAADVTISITSNDTSEGTVSTPLVTFTSLNWNIAQTVTVTGVDDFVDDGDINYTILTGTTSSLDGAYNGLLVPDVGVTNVDNDTLGVTVGAISGTTTEAGGTATFTVVLNTMPSADVTIGITSNDTSEGTVSTALVTFTSLNWNITQTVTVTGVDDFVDDGNIIYTILTGATTSSDATYNGLVVPDVGVTNEDNDTLGVTVGAISGTTTEAGGTATFTVVLNSLPAANVTVNITSNDLSEGTVSTPLMTFTSLNWNIAQTVTVTGVDDFVDDGNIIYTILTGTTSSLDVTYNGLVVPDVGVTNVDDDMIGVTVGTISGSTTEAGGTATFTMVLTSLPAADVAISLVSNDLGEGTVSTALVTFTSLNWNIAQTITVTGVDDALLDGDEAYTIVTGTTVSLDPFYSGLVVADVAVTNLDDEVAAGVMVSGISSATTESGGAATFNIRLVSQPTANVGIPLVSTDLSEGTISTSLVTFTNLNWNIVQTVTVTGVDDFVDDGNINYTILTGNVTSLDALYDALGAANVDDISVTNTDNDTIGVTVGAISGNTTEAGGTATFSVVLNSEPTANVTIPLSSNDTSEGTIAQSNLVFTSLNWNIIQTVTVTGVDDAIVDTNITYAIVTGNVTSPDPLYNALNGASVDNVTVINEDNDSASLAIADQTVNEDSGNLSFTVTLDRAVVGGTSVSYSFTDVTATGGGTDYTSTGGTLIFSGTINEQRTINVPLIDDAVIEDTETFTVQLGVPTNGVNLAGGGNATGTITDDDNCAATPILDTDVPLEFCDTITVSLNDYTNSIPPNANFELTWSVNPDPLVVSGHLSSVEVNDPINGGTYYGFFYDAANSCASNPLVVTLVINSTPTITSTTPAEICGEGTVTLEATASVGATINWYSNASGGTILGTGTNFITGTISITTNYFVEAIANGCISARELVVATVNEQPSAGTVTNTTACNVTANGAATVDLDTRLDGAEAGVWTITTDPSNSIVIGTGNVVDFNGVPDGDYVFTYTTNVASPPCTDQSVELTIAVNDCLLDSDNDGIKDVNEADLGTDPNNDDSDGDGIKDGAEVGNDLSNPLDEDEDNIIDALESTILDADNDGVMDQQDPENNNPCVPDNTHNLCDTDEDGISDGEEIANGTDHLDPCDPNINASACNPDPIDLMVVKEADRLKVIEGENVVFTITLTNNETERKAINIIVRDLIAENMGFAYVSHEISIGIYDAASGDWLVDELLAGANETLKITVSILSSGSYQNTVNLMDSFPSDNMPDNNTATITLQVGKRTVADCGALFNQFSPNSDGLNDFLSINCVENYPDNKLEIYDRYGNEVFSAKSYNNTWDGTGSNGNLPKGTYFYILDLGDGSEITKGWIQILR